METYNLASSLLVQTRDVMHFGRTTTLSHTIHLTVTNIGQLSDISLIFFSEITQRKKKGTPGLIFEMTVAKPRIGLLFSPPPPHNLRSQSLIFFSTIFFFYVGEGCQEIDFRACKITKTSSIGSSEFRCRFLS